MKIKLVTTNYNGVFYRLKNNKWRKFWSIGNASIAEEILVMLSKLGHKTILDDRTNYETD